MLIGFFGASELSWTGYSFTDKFSGKSSRSWNDLACKHLNAEQYNRAVLQGSSERALMELKKCKKSLDLAVIGISQPKFAYLPRCDVDFRLDHDSVERAEQIFDIKGVQHGPKYESHRNLCEQFGNKEEFINTYNLFKKHLYDPELMMNRHAGALIQIDSWLKSKNIRTIYFCKSKYLPPWVDLTAGPKFEEILEFCEENRIYENLPNNLSRDAQFKIAAWFVKTINKER